MKNNFLLIVAFLLIFVSCNKSEDPILPEKQVQTESTLLNKQSGGKAIKGSLTYNSNQTISLACNDCASGTFSDGNYLGSGNLSHLGNVSSKTKACFSFIFNSSFTQVIGVHIASQCTSFTAPNGDQLNLTNDPYDLYMNAYGVAVGTCKFYFAGGTGKYANASGSFNGYVENALQGSFTVDIEGTLSY